MSHPTFPETFVVQRDEDVSGISGEGIVAEGVQFSDGWVVTHWLDQPPMNEPKTDVWHNKGAAPFRKIHGHGGSTRILWADEVAAARRKALADMVEAFDVPPEICGTEAEGAYWRQQIECALRGASTEMRVEHVEDLPGVPGPVELRGWLTRFTDAVVPILTEVLEQRNRAKGAAGRAYLLADRWEAAHGSSMFLVRAAGAELRDVLDDSGRTRDKFVHAQPKAQDSGPSGVDYAATEATGLHRPDTRAATEATDGCTNACESATGIRGLLEHVGIDTTGRDITVAGNVVDAAKPTACDAYQPPTEPADSGFCARCGMYDYKHHARPVRRLADTQPTPTDDAQRASIAAALTAEHYRRAEARIVASPEEHCAAMADAVMRVLRGVDTTDDAPTTTARRPVVSVHGARDMSPEAREAVGALVDVAKRQMTEAPASDEDAQRTARRDSTRNLLDGLAHRGYLSSDETALLRQHIDAETRDADTFRAVARANLRHVQEMLPELGNAEAAIERVREVPPFVERVLALSGPGVSRVAVQRIADRLRAALDGTEQPTSTEA